MKTRLLASMLALASFPLLAGTGKEYLALGDSVAFGYDPLVTVPIESNYTGYPQIVARWVPRFSALESLACPGETSASFLSSAAVDRGCRAFRGLFGIHTNYVGTQADFAIAVLQSEQQINLVTLSLGANDLLLLLEICQGQPACITQGLPAVLQGYGANLATVLGRIRQEARYDRRIVLVTYYSPDYRDPLQTQAVAALAAVAKQVAGQFNVQIADGFRAFALASALKGGDTCAAGLLVRISPTACDVHPSPLGRDLLAATVLLQAFSR